MTPPVFTDTNEAYQWYIARIKETAASLPSDEDRYDFLDLLVVELDDLLDEGL